MKKKKKKKKTWLLADKRHTKICPPAVPHNIFPSWTTTQFRGSEQRRVARQVTTVKKGKKRRVSLLWKTERNIKESIEKDRKKSKRREEKRRKEKKKKEKKRKEKKRKEKKRKEKRRKEKKTKK